MMGVSFVAGQFNRRFDCEGADCEEHRYYAGIHANTDLGAPLTEAPVWLAHGKDCFARLGWKE